MEVTRNSIVCFFDILGTCERVKEGEYDDIQALDFANPVGLVARHNQKMRFAVFSDSVIFSCPEEEAKSFVAVVSYLYSQWFSDCVIVRGGVSVGEINWVDDRTTDDMFRCLRNLSLSRVYGKALVAAHSTEDLSGPGAICFLDEPSSALLKRIDSKFVLAGPTDALVWLDKSTLEYWSKVLPMWKSSYAVGEEARRHLTATIDYLSRVRDNEKWHPDSFMYSAVGLP